MDCVALTIPVSMSDNRSLHSPSQALPYGSHGMMHQMNSGFNMQISQQHQQQQQQQRQQQQQQQQQQHNVNQARHAQSQTPQPWLPHLSSAPPPSATGNGDPAQFAQASQWEPNPPPFMAGWGGHTQDNV